MKIQKTILRTIKISEIEKLDPITVMIDQAQEGKGKIIIDIFGKNWSAYWGSMSYSTLEEFFLSCENSYLVNCLDRAISSTIVDYDAIPKYLQNLVVKNRKSLEIDKDKARVLFDELEYVSFEDKHSVLSFTIDGLYGWKNELPTIDNHEYVYLDRIVTAIKEAFAIEKTS